MGFVKNPKNPDFPKKNLTEFCDVFALPPPPTPQLPFWSDPEKMPLGKCCSQLHGNLESMEFDPS